MTRAIVFAGAFVVALWLFGRRSEPPPTIGTIWWTKDGWRDFEPVDSV